MGAVFVRQAIYDALMQGPEAQIELFHGYTYSGHPVACAAALAALGVYESEDLFARARALSSKWAEAMHSLRGLPNVIDVRAIGLVAGIELDPRPGAPGARAYEVFVDCFERGLLIRVTGDIIALSPPLIVEEDHINAMVSLLSDALKRLS
jgi:beta-alanine--pyruvate transaminase